MATPQDPAVTTAVTDAVQQAPVLVKDVETGNIPGAATTAITDYTEDASLFPEVVSEVKAGYKTSEFWLVLVYEILTQTGAIHLPGEWGKVIAGVVVILGYVISRGIAKHGSPTRKIVKKSP